MRVDSKLPTTPTTSAALQRREAIGPRFSLNDPTGTGQAKAAASTAPLATVDALLALQGEADPGERRRRAAKRGNDLLDSLDRLKAALLSGRVATATLTQLAGQVAQAHEASGDRQLDELIGHIELRAQVELAKLGRP